MTYVKHLYSPPTLPESEPKSSKRSLCDYLLDSVGEDDKAYEDTYCPIQVPHLGFVFEHFSTDEDREAHDPPHQRVESWRKTTHTRVSRWCSTANLKYCT